MNAAFLHPCFSRIKFRSRLCLTGYHNTNNNIVAAPFHRCLASPKKFVIFFPSAQRKFCQAAKCRRYCHMDHYFGDTHYENIIFTAVRIRAKQMHRCDLSHYSHRTIFRAALRLWGRSAYRKFQLKQQFEQLQ